MHRHGLAKLADALAGGPTEDDGATAARACLDRTAPRPSAITVFSDRCATGVLDVLNKTGIGVPPATANASTAGSPSVKSTTNPTCTGFVNGLRRDEAAVRNGLTLAHRSGAVEGGVNRIQMIKRYGRAGFDLLQKRVLHAH